MIYLTSFFKTKELPMDVEVWSAAVYQPKGYTFPKADWTDIRDQYGKWIRPREFLDEADPAAAYFAAMCDHYLARVDAAEEWLADLNGDAALVCWCPYDRAAKRQLAEFGSFICHTSPLGTFLSETMGEDVVYDEDRQKMYGVV